VGHPVKRNYIKGTGKRKINDRTWHFPYSTLSLKAFLIKYVLDIHVLDIHVLDIHVLDIHVLDIHVFVF